MGQKKFMWGRPFCLTYKLEIDADSICLSNEGNEEKTSYPKYCKQLTWIVPLLMSLCICKHMNKPCAFMAYMHTLTMKPTERIYTITQDEKQIFSRMKVKGNELFTTANRNVLGKADVVLIIKGRNIMNTENGDKMLKKTNNLRWKECLINSQNM